MKATVEAIGFVETTRTKPIDDFWGDARAIITLTEKFHAESLQGLEEFSHVEILFLFHKVDLANVVTEARHPRNNRDWPKIGIFAQRGKNRPNRIGSTICRVLGVEDKRLHVAELDAIDGTPILDIKPVMTEFLPRNDVRQPGWSTELMGQYWYVSR